jgi:endoglucanase
MNRRTLLVRLAHAGFALGLTTDRLGGMALGDNPPEPTPAKLPRWRGFNLLEMFQQPFQRPFVESDFASIAELGFDFVRLPLDYRCWTDPSDWTKLREEMLKRVDEAVAFGKKHGIHVQINFHRAPGYTVAQPPEARSLWKDEDARRVCALHWSHFARRYQGRPGKEVSFNLFNEPSNVKPETYRQVVEIMVRAIREHDPNRLIVCDGRDWGNTPPVELVGLNVAAATRGYEPFHLTHYKAGWVQGADRWSVPTYPLHERGGVWDRARLQKEKVEPWRKLQQEGMGVMVGEFGAHNQTPHDVVLPWMRDCLANWKSAGWGWALWNFRGSFGVLDSERRDVAYESYKGHKLDRAMLELLQAG